MKQFFLWMLLSVCLIACNNEAKDESKTTATTPASDASSTKTAKAPIELLEASASDPIKASLEAFTKGDAAGFAAVFADNGRINFSGGDSLIGKQAIQDYYAGRLKVIDNIKFSEHIFLPINATESPNGGATPGGKWILEWHKVDVKYKTGKSIAFWMHTAYHFNDAGKVDAAAQYMDRLPVKLASK